MLRSIKNHQIYQGVYFKIRRIFERQTFFMTVKLNLTINESVARRIKSYASRKKTSVSKIVESQLEEVLKSEKKDDSFRKFLDKYAGSIKGGINYDQAKDEYIKKKYGL
jgi:hypothetical protein